MIGYSADVERQMKLFYDTLSEKDKRRYAAVEAAKLGHGGLAYLARVLECHPNTIRQGKEDVSLLPEDEAEGRTRKQGGGRKSCTEVMPELKDNLAQVISDHTAGDPMQDDVIWTDLTQEQIALELAQLGTPISPATVQNLLDECEFSKRKAQRRQTMGFTPQRNAQFERIAELKAEYLDSPNPILSMDTKKKEPLGNFFREGWVYTNKVRTTWDHDFRSHATGLVIPHGLYDLKRNVGHVTLGLDHDTSEFACESLWVWWRDFGRKAYRDADSLLVLCDGGGSNSSRHHIFKEDVKRLVNKMGLPIRIAHYPPHCSKYNPIEHRLFPHVTRACQGVIFHTLDIVKRCIRRTSTRTGLRVTLKVLDKLYELGRKATDRFFESYPIDFDDYLPQWNYIVNPGDY